MLGTKSPLSFASRHEGERRTQRSRLSRHPAPPRHPAPRGQPPTSKLLSLGDSLVEVHCECPAKIALARYNARPRHPVHVTTMPMSAMGKHVQPVGIGSLITVDTTKPVDVPAVAPAGLAA